MSLISLETTNGPILLNSARIISVEVEERKGQHLLLIATAGGSLQIVKPVDGGGGVLAPEVDRRASSEQLLQNFKEFLAGIDRLGQ